MLHAAPAELSPHAYTLSREEYANYRAGVGTAALYAAIRKRFPKLRDEDRVPLYSPNGKVALERVPGEEILAP